MRFFKIIIGIVFLLWSAACAVNACGLFKSLGEIQQATGHIDPNDNSVMLISWSVSLLIALGAFGTGGYLITKR